MKRYTLLLVLVLVAVLATSLLAQNSKLGVLTPRSNEIKYIDKKFGNAAADLNALKSTHKVTGTLGVIDTLRYAGTANVNFGAYSNDIYLEWFDPGADCIIKEVLINFYAKGSHGLTSLQLFKTDFPDNVPDDAYDGAGWVGFYGDEGDPVGTGSIGPTSAAGDWVGADWGGYDPLKEEIWGMGGFPITIPDDAGWVSTQMIFLGAEPELVAGEKFAVVVNILGADWTDDGRMAILSIDDAAPPHPGLKYYAIHDQNPGGGGGSGHYGWIIRKYIWQIFVVVEFTSNTPPTITPGGPYGTVLSSDARTIDCRITDIDAANPATAGVASAKLLYQVNDGDVTSVDMTLASGTDTDGTWEGIIPAGTLSAGDVVTYSYEATDKAGASSEAAGGSYGYFAKVYDLLVFYNDDGTSYPSWILSPYYDNLWVYADNDTLPVDYDVWVGLNDGALSAELIDQYENMVIIDAYSPATMNDAALGAWFAAGPKNMFWSSQEWAGNFCGGWGADDDSTFAADDWHNMYLGLETVGGAGHDIATDPFPINPVTDDEISGGLAQYAADSSAQLYIDCDYELGFTNWSDAFTAAPHAVVCFTDSAEGRTMGVHTDNAGYKTVFLGFDQLCLDFGHGVWTEPNVSSVVGNSLKWFGLTSDVEETTPGIVAEYSLKQNYPNPFNPETKITYSLSQPGLVKLSVYNVLGQKVADLVNEHKAPATYHVTWNAKDVASGVYFYRIEAGDYTKTMKMMLLRQSLFSFYRVSDFFKAVEEVGISPAAFL